MNKSKIKCFLQVNACVSQGVNWAIQVQTDRIRKNICNLEKHG